MEKKTDIHAVEIVRCIRDQQAKSLQGKSDTDIIEYFHRASERFRKSRRPKGRGVANQRMQPPARKAHRG
jgi:hypothetical protein